MSNPLRKRFKRELKSNIGRYSAIFIIFTVMVLIISGFLVTSNGAQLAYETDRLESNAEDGRFAAAAPLAQDAWDDVEQLGISITENYYLDAEVLSGQTIRIYKNRSTVNLPTVWEGALPLTPDDIALDRIFANNHSLAVGDALRVMGRDFTVCALVSLPDYSSLFLSNTDLLMDSFGFGVALVAGDAFAALPQENIVHNYAYRYTNRELTATEKIDLSDDVKDRLIERQVPLTAFLMAEDNQAISFFYDDLGSDVPMMKTFLYIILVIMAFVFTVIISSTVEEESAIIGTLLASGYRKGELIRHYLTLPLGVTLCGAAIGNILSYTLGVQIFSRLYYGTYSLPPMIRRFNGEAFLLTTLLPAVLIAVINLIMLSRTLSLSPLKFLRRDLKRSKQKKALRLPNISFLGRFRLRVILQNIGNYIILFFGLTFASFILLFGLCMGPIIRNYVSSMEAAAVSEYQYLLKAPYEVETKDAEGFSIKSLETYYPAADKNLEITFYGVPEDTRYWGLDTAGMAVDEVILSDGLCKKMGIRIGDTITFTDPRTNEEYTLRVAGIKEYPAGFSAFMNLSCFNNMLGRDEGYINGYLSNTPLDIPETHLATVITPDDLSKMAARATSTFEEMASICLVAAGVIYLAVLYVLTKIVVDKNAPNISFMKVMGYKSKEIKRLYLSATTLSVAVSLLLCLPLISLGLKGAFALAFVRINGYLETYLPPQLFVIVALAGFVCYLLVNLVHIKQIDKIEMAAVLKNRE